MSETVLQAASALPFSSLSKQLSTRAITDTMASESQLWLSRSKSGEISLSSTSKISASPEVNASMCLTPQIRTSAAAQA